MTLCKEEGPRHPIFFTMNKFKPQSLISSVLFGCVLLHRPRHFQLMELQSSSISGNPTRNFPTRREIENFKPREFPYAQGNGIFSLLDFLMNIFSYKAIITGKCVGHKYDSDKRKIFHEEKTLKLKICKKQQNRKKIPLRVGKFSGYRGRFCQTLVYVLRLEFDFVLLLKQEQQHPH